MLVLNSELCAGCGACIEVCPTAALYLVDGRAALDITLCRECEACIAACPAGAISTQDRAPARALESKADAGVVTVRSVALPIPLRARVLPLAGAALGWAAREIVPRLIDHWLDGLQYQPADRQSTGDRPAGQSARGPQGIPQQRRRRRQGQRD